jgi:RNA polymerase sigma-70 factor, ECF subfamily
MSGTSCTTDGELIQRTGRHEHEAVEALHRRHSGRVYRAALKRLRDRGRAEDATQDTFTAIWRSAATHRPERGTGTAWLYTVTRNTIVDRLRARTEKAAEPDDAPDNGPGPAERAEADWVRSRVHAALETLPERERTLIALAYWKGLPHPEIAAHTGLPMGTVKARIRSALARLADTLEEDDLL